MGLQKWISKVAPGVALESKRFVDNDLKLLDVNSIDELSSALVQLQQAVKEGVGIIRSLEGTGKRGIYNGDTGILSRMNIGAYLH